MAEDWDLYAVVRSCKTPQTTSSTAATTTTTTNSAVTTDPMKVVKTTSLSSEDTLSCLASLTFEEENDPFCFPDLGEPRSKAFQELQEFYKPFFSNNPTTTTTTTSTTTSTHQGIIPNSSISDFGGSSGQHHVPQQQQHHHQQRLGPHRNDAVVNGPHQFTPQPYISGFDGVVVPRRVHHDQQDQNNQLLSPVATTTPTPPLPLPPLPLPTMSISPTTRSRKRKNQLKKMVCHVSAENLSSDLWAWRKYGQKPIKGSPYPRNYYRCSSSKGCAARKQVERSNTDPDTFIVTYTGDHTHPRPTHRNSLAGSTRNKLSPATTTTKREGSDQSPPPQQSTSSLSPTTQLTVAQAEEKDQVEKGDEKPIGEDILMEDEMDLENELDDEDDDDVLIPNMALSDDFFLGLKEMGCSPPGAAC